MIERVTDRTANLLGALALALADRLEAGASAVPGGASAGAALVAVRNHPGETIRQLQGTLALTHSGTVRLLAGLEEAGLVERPRSGADGRAAAVRLTPAGERQAEAILAQRAALLASALGAVPPQDAAGLGPALEAMLDRLTGDAASARRICRLCDEGACRPGGCPVERKAGSDARTG